MQVRGISHMFGNLRFTKTAAEIVEKCKSKTIALKAKIEERQKRVADLRREYEIDDAALIELLTAARKQQNSLSNYSYSTSKLGIGGKKELEEKVIGAGVVNNLLTESDFIEGERDQVRTLEMIARNLKPIPRFASGNGTPLPEDEFVLDSEELEYLGF